MAIQGHISDQKRAEELWHFLCPFSEMCFLGGPSLDWVPHVPTMPDVGIIELLVFFPNLPPKQRGSKVRIGWTWALLISRHSHSGGNILFPLFHRQTQAPFGVHYHRKWVNGSFPVWRVADLGHSSIHNIQLWLFISNSASSEKNRHKHRSFHSLSLHKRATEKVAWQGS